MTQTWAETALRDKGLRCVDWGAEVIWPLGRQPGVDAQAKVKPAPNVVARRTSAVYHLVMAAAAAQVAGPAGAARLLAVDVSVVQPASLQIPVYPFFEVAHLA